MSAEEKARLVLSAASPEDMGAILSTMEPVHRAQVRGATCGFDEVHILQTN